MSLCTWTSKNSIFVFEYFESNFIFWCFWFSSLINFNASSSVPVHIMNKSSMNRKNVYIWTYINDFYIWTYIFWFEACLENMNVSGSAYCVHRTPFDLNIMFWRCLTQVLMSEMLLLLLLLSISSDNYRMRVSPLLFFPNSVCWCTTIKGPSPANKYLVEYF